jgi:3-hydroxybutyryl-CoA dehydrogenase
MGELIAVIGAGTMGAGIAQTALSRGFQTVLYDTAESPLEKGRLAIASGLAKLVEKGKLTPNALDTALAGLTLTTQLSELSTADIVIEAAPERISIKQDLFRFLDGFLKPEALLASNTSSLSITSIASATKRPERVLGLHFFNPAPLMPLVEVIKGSFTSAETMAQATRFIERLGKTPVVAQDTPGFIVNRVARPYYGEALKLLGEGGTDAAQIDRIMKGLGGFRMGPFELMDLIGIDVNFQVTQSVYQAFFNDARYRPHPIQQRMVDAGTLGRKSGKGFFDYPTG